MTRRRTATPPDQDTVLARLSAAMPELKEYYGVAHIRLFGSTARGTTRKSSDIDLMVSFARPVGLLGLSALKNRLEAVLEHPVDLATPDALSPELRETVEREGVHVA